MITSRRITLSLDGCWEIDESMAGDAMPREFRHYVPVPGLANLAEPPFRDIDRFESYELIENRVRMKQLPEDTPLVPEGVSRQERNYLWYRRSFGVSEKREVALLRINKAQFGVAVWLNGRSLGEDPSCFSSTIWDLTNAIDWSGENVLVVRIGAHPGVLPPNFPAGTDFEKLKWTPGIYDRVSLVLCDNPVIESVQVASRLATSEIVVQTTLCNRGTAQTTKLDFAVSEWRGGRVIAEIAAPEIALAAGEEKTITHTIRLPNPRHWCPDDPFLYVVRTRTSGDEVKTRFGFREFRGDGRSGRFFLNGKPCWLRGSNITLHRFFEDPDCAHRPWDEAWVQKLLVELPRKLSWNAFRFTIGPVPERWFEIADETGLLIQNEFFVWTGDPAWTMPDYKRNWDANEMIRQFRRWMRDHWNFASVVIWDACNETLDPVWGAKIIPAVRDLDLSGRPWDNGYNAPHRADDPAEIHIYFYASSWWSGSLQFRPAELETMTFDQAFKIGGDRAYWRGHPLIVNEYGWLWVRRDGAPTLLTEKVFEYLFGANATSEQRLAYYAYMVAAETEYFRATRDYAGVLHFVYLTCSYPGVFTSDSFRDVKTLELEPHFADYASEAFKPLGVYVRFFQPHVAAGSMQKIPVVVINDYSGAIAGPLVVSLESENGESCARSDVAFSVDAAGRNEYVLELWIPDRVGRHVVKGSARAANRPDVAPTVSRRWVEVRSGRES